MQTPAPRQSDPLLVPFTLKGLRLRNRIVSTSHASMFDEDGMPTERYQAYHEEKARGGLALTMIGGSAMVSKDSSWGGGQLDFSDDRIVPHLQRLSQRIHDRGAAVMSQISHLGRRANALHGNWLPTIAPSRLRETRSRSFPREMDRQDIDRVIRDYAAAALRAREGGLDGIETLTGGHLIGQFMSPLSNIRGDGFGGSLQNRARFGLMVHEALREAAGDKMVIGIRLVIDEGVTGGLTLADGIALAEMFERAGTVDFFNCIYGRMDSDLSLSEDNMPGLFQPDAPYLEAVRLFRAQTRLPLMHAGGIRDTATARHAVREGIVDLVGMTRAHLADPQLVRKLRNGTEDRIRPCVGASYCLYKKATCIHNPASGNERDLAHVPPKSQHARKVVVVGGGVAGLEAARVAAERGHEVVLFEAAAELGGQVRLAARAPERASLIGIVDWRVAELRHLGVRQNLNFYAEPSDIISENPDFVLIATGGVPDTGWLEGDALCTTVWDILAGTVPAKAEILVYDGTGRQAAPSAALHLARAGHTVCLATPDSVLGQEMSYQDSTGFRKRFAELGIPRLTDVSLCEVRRQGTRLEAILSDCFTGARTSVLADQIVIENGTAPLDDLFHALRAQSNNDGISDYGGLLTGSGMPPGKAGFALHRIGDAVASRDIHAAIRDAWRLAMTL